MDTSGNIIFDYEVTGSAASSIDTGSILNGDVDGWYTVIIRSIGVTTNSAILMQLNGDSGANYGRRGIQANNTTVADWSGTDETGIYTGGAYVGETGLTIATIYAKSGAVRLVNMIRAWEMTETTVTYLTTAGNVWSNADNLTSMTFAATGNYIAIGTRVIILKGNAFAVGSDPDGSTAWHRVGSHVCSGAEASITFNTGIDGNTAICYYISTQMLNAYNGGSSIFIRPNNDSGANYGLQRVQGQDTTASAFRGTTSTAFTSGYCDAINKYSMGASILFAKSGFLRPLISTVGDGISGTGVLRTGVYGYSWSNTADNITSFVVTNQNGNMGDGSQIDVYALYV